MTGSILFVLSTLEIFGGAANPFLEKKDAPPKARPPRFRIS